MIVHARPRRALALVTAAVSVLAACSSGATPTLTDVPDPAGAASPGATGGCPETQPAPLGPGETRTVTIATSLGEIELRIEADLSPIAAGNFIALAECGWYDGVVFHRVVPGFVIQGGDGQFGRVDAYDPGQVGTGGPPYTIEDEAVTTTYRRGTVAMARTPAPNSVGSQFFIVLDDAAAGSLGDPQYNNYQIIGEVTSGMDTVDSIAGSADAEQPSRPVVMDDVTVSEP
mgnify:CR=1 FL=1